MFQFMKQKLLRNRIMGIDKLSPESMDEEEKIRVVLGSRFAVSQFFCMYSRLLWSLCRQHRIRKSRSIRKRDSLILCASHLFVFYVPVVYNKLCLYFIVISVLKINTLYVHCYIKESCKLIVIWPQAQRAEQINIVEIILYES